MSDRSDHPMRSKNLSFDSLWARGAMFGGIMVPQIRVAFVVLLLCWLSRITVLVRNLIGSLARFFPSLRLGSSLLDGASSKDIILAEAARSRSTRQQSIPRGIDVAAPIGRL